MNVSRDNHEWDSDLGKSFKALGVVNSQALVSFYAFIGCNKQGILTIIPNNPAGIQL